MKYLQTTICTYVITRLQQEASARSGNDTIRASEFTSDDDQPLAAKKITEPFDIRFPRYALNCHDSDIIVDMRKLNARPKPNTFDTFWEKMAEMIEGRPRIQVELPITYQAHPPPAWSRHLEGYVRPEEL